MRTISVNKEKEKKVRTLKTLLIASVSVTVVASILLIWDVTSTVNGNGDNALNSVNMEDVVGTSTKCNGEEIDAANVYESFTGDRKWLLLGEEFDDSENSLILSVYVDPDYDEEVPSDEWNVTYSVVGTNVQGKFSNENKFKYTAKLPAQDLEPGTYNVEALIDLGCGSAVRTTPYEFNVSYPLYITWTQDWEGDEINDQYLNDMEKISADHGIPMTHFFNPRIYVTNEISESRAQYFTDWVIRRQTDYGDDIGLHLHMHYDMVQAAGVTPRYDTDRWGGHSNGYDSITADYTLEETLKIMEWAIKQFEEKDLGTPTMYRAGGWFADEDTLKAAEKAGFALDSSGRTSYQLGSNNLPGYWDLSSTTKPYQMNSNDQNLTYDPNMDLWQFPNNGGDSWAFSQEEMIGRYNDNYNGTPLRDKQVVTYLSHPHWFHEDKPKLEGLFNEIDKDLYRSDNGPVIYVTLSEAYEIWTLPNGSY